MVNQQFDFSMMKRNFIKIFHRILRQVRRLPFWYILVKKFGILVRCDDGWDFCWQQVQTCSGMGLLTSVPSSGQRASNILWSRWASNFFDHKFTRRNANCKSFFFDLFVDYFHLRFNFYFSRANISIRVCARCLKFCLNVLAIWLHCTKYRVLSVLSISNIPSVLSVHRYLVLCTVPTGSLPVDTVCTQYPVSVYPGWYEQLLPL